MDAALLLEIVAILAGITLLIVPTLNRIVAARSVDRRLHAALAWYGSAGLPDERGVVLLRLLSATGRLLIRTEAARADLAQQLRLAGLSGDVAYAFAGGRLFASLAVGLLAWLMNPLSAGTPGQAMGHATIAALLTAVLIGRALFMRARSRSVRLRAEMPASIHTLTVALEGGAGIEQALRFSAEQQAHPSRLFQRALVAAVADLERGMPHDEVLARIGERLASDEANAMVEVMRQSLRHGTEIIPPLRALANDLSERRLADARGAVGRATAAMTVVLVVCFIPTLLVLICAPSVSGLLRVLGDATR
ncbi:type II secretion system F family protein [Roseomonas chloroacetimidivorans]|jgi:pilus assembly protein TadC|uniref:type II secretion system F family protein n=1 Tax=Roseomonas chloroacetimidivorans TaxID=1766656 RepID=UPI003C71B5FB